MNKRTIIFLLAVITMSWPALAVQPTFETAFSPHQGATELVVKTINEAKKSIRVAAFSFTSNPIADALIAAHERGVDVEILLDKTKEDKKVIKIFDEEHVPVRVNYQYKIMHNKFMIIDEKTLELGSFNYTNAAEHVNAENVLVIHDADSIVKDYSSQWKKLWDEGNSPKSMPSEN